jgi:hypothetical protein
LIKLPPAVPKPCSDCPWRRNAAPGWLGPHTAQEWIRLAHGEAPIACHQTIPKGSDEMEPEKTWAVPGVRQCKGAAIYRTNVFKSPHNPTDAEHDSEADAEAVFSSVTGDDFIAYHEPHEGRYRR